jgi:hypothetical protein
MMILIEKMNTDAQNQPIANRFDSLLLLKKLEAISINRVGYACSWISILAHIAPYIPKTQKVSFNLHNHI